MKFEIKSTKTYDESVKKVYRLMDKGESNLNKADLKKLAGMSAAIEVFEDKCLGLIPKKEAT